MNSKSFFSVALLAICVLCVGLWQFSSNDKALDKVSLANMHSSTVSSEADVLEAADVDGIIQNDDDLNNSKVNAMNDKEGLSSLDKKDIADWHKNDVLTNEAANSDYISYADELLTSLSSSGDLKATKILAVRYLDRISQTTDLDQISDLMKKNAELVERAIVYGDREFFGVMPKISKANSKITSPNSTAEQKHQATIEVLAYAEFMALRGEFGAKYQEQKNLYSIYGVSDRLTVEDKAAIKTKAKEIYDYYEAQRIQLGLGAFDNTVPAGKQKIHQKMQENYNQEMGENAF